MARQVVHNDDIAGFQAGDQQLFHIGLEGIAVHGAVNDHGRGQASRPEAGDERGGLPMAPGDGGRQTLAFRGAAPAPGHVGLGPRLINEDKPFRP